MKRLLVLVLFFCPLQSPAGFELVFPGARQNAVARTGAASADDAWALFYNPAGLASIRSFQCAFSYSPSAFSFPELAMTAAGLVIPLNGIGLGCGVRSFGYSLYRETSFSVAGGCSLPGLAIGATLNLHTVAISGYGSAAVCGVDAGVLLELSGSLTCGAMIRNINAPSVGKGGEPLPQSLTAGVRWRPTAEISLAGECVSEEPFDVSGRVGCEAELGEYFKIRAGISDQPDEFTAGFGIGITVFQVDYALQSHRELGMTHVVTLTIR
jgi:hypothetical protein